MPIGAAGAEEQASLASPEQGADFLEIVGQKAAPAKKKSIMPIILIGVGVLAVTAAVLFLVVLKNYDITGSWTIVFTWISPSSYTSTLTFAFFRTRESGTVIVLSDDGPDTVDGKKVTWTLSSENPNFVWAGKFTGKDAMEGTMVYPSEGGSGTWTATRIGAAAVQSEPSATGNPAGNWGKAD